MNFEQRYEEENNFEKQAARMGADIRYGIATKVDFTGPIHKVQIDEENQ